MDTDTFSMDTLQNRIHQRCKDLHITHTQLAEKSGVSINTINSWFRDNDTDDYGNKKNNTPKIDKLYQVAIALDTSLDYLTGREEFTHAGNKDMSNFTGLSDTAIECLRGWYQDKQQAGLLHQYSNDTETLNTILEYYGNIRKQNKKKGLINGFSLFHFIGNFFNAHNFKRVQQDLVRYGNGSHFNKIEVGDTITKKDTGTSEVIEHLCTPISSGSFRGEDTTKLDIYNTENESEQYYIELSDIYREHCKSQIINILKKIGGIQ